MRVGTGNFQKGIITAGGGGAVGYLGGSSAYMTGYGAVAGNGGDVDCTTNTSSPSNSSPQSSHL